MAARSTLWLIGLFSRQRRLALWLIDYLSSCPNGLLVIWQLVKWRMGQLVHGPVGRAAVFSLGHFASWSVSHAGHAPIWSASKLVDLLNCSTEGLLDSGHVGRLASWLLGNMVRWPVGEWAIWKPLTSWIAKWSIIQTMLAYEWKYLILDISFFYLLFAWLPDVVHTSFTSLLVCVCA